MRIYSKHSNFRLVYMGQLRDLTVLLSAANSPSMPGQLSCFRHNGERNIRIIGVDMSDDPSLKYLVDVFYQMPAADDPRYCDMILNICKREKVDVYFPNISAELNAVVARKEEFEKVGTHIAVSNHESISIGNNKLKTYDFLKSKGIPVPKYYGIHSLQDFIDGCKEMGYPEKPVCIKMAENSGSRGVRIIDANKSRYHIFAHEKPNSFYTSYDDMISILSEREVIDEMLLVECMHDPEFTVDALAHNGETLYIVGRENVVSLMSIAQESILKYDELAYNISKQVIAALKMEGNVGFDFMRNDRGEAVLMDINPRLTATVSIIGAGGVNLPYLRVKQLLGEPLPEQVPVYGTRLKRRYGEMFTTPNGELIDF